MRPLPDIAQLKEGILAGNIALLSRAITLIESTNPAHQVLAGALIDQLLPYTGNSLRIGITGVPGVGKSTFIESFGMHLIGKGKKLAVLAIDPSSNISKGSILGDKTRMEQLSVHPMAYIRPSAASGSLGGVTYKTRETTLLCEAAGFDTIIIETVGVGQSETEVSQISDFFLLLMLAGAGDELQGIKRGIMEMADGLIITKADGDNILKSKSARSEYARALHFLPPNASGWIPEVKICSAYDRTGIIEVDAMIEKFHQHQQANGYFLKKRNEQNLFAFRQLLNEALFRQLLAQQGIKDQVKKMETLVFNNQVSPYSAVRQVLDLLPGFHHS
ncbi:methylmalonyl Co-A mutase-associated GTPase MeaB [Taibaiella sp. KBW10]|uniref:methylmalonyl Co-A mutase-associated GTPase MeaB n=1 Tax=Taibaiella sp. KBW10 TaxID=2153357 RepID=UPI000F5B4AB5|nr:methylmalonyl Co-A mutase-associated GTPase MeaB [Taibaiella sp. KBW10]RQO30515.1 methylmalonyl Co-A mutase-associated GTPase MeaB [Taibaiella sp. KBW10]